ncbi:TPA: hypothetical protein EYG96_00325 [Candidatus Gracilibacteria bacterium]|nr:hypothetical protein [Candidatus Peregrinibacteria bacterium]HIQ56474.1 hypothetical protein [Candidatus Gracilibacteria bacterium]
MSSTHTHTRKKNKRNEDLLKTFFKHTIACTAGGLLGTAIALSFMVGLLYANTSNTLTSEDFSGTSLLVIIFILSFSANLSAVYFLLKADKEKYIYTKHTLQAAFYLNIFLFITALPFYLLSSTQSFTLTIIGIHLFLSASGSALFAEIFAGVKYAVSGVIGVSISQILLILIYIGIGAPSSNTMVTVLFTPFIWMILPMVIFGTERIYFAINSKIFK